MYCCCHSPTSGKDVAKLDNAPNGTSKVQRRAGWRDGSASQQPSAGHADAFSAHHDVI